MKEHLALSGRRTLRARREGNPDLKENQRNELIAKLKEKKRILRNANRAAENKCVKNKWRFK